MSLYLGYTKLQLVPLNQDPSSSTQLNKYQHANHLCDTSTNFWEYISELEFG